MRLQSDSIDGSHSGIISMLPVLPFNKSSLQGRELEFIFQTISHGQIAGDQTFSKKCHELLEEVVGVRRALVTTSCTHSLEIVAILLLKNRQNMSKKHQ